MAFIRIKKINGTPYAYLVESVKTKKGPRQKFKGYLGRVHELERVDASEVEHENVLLKLALQVLSDYGFREEGKRWKRQSLVFNPNSLGLQLKKKKAILGVNEGHLCEFTLKRIKNFKKSADPVQDGRKLAKYFLEAGLPVNEKDFVEYYQSL